MKIRDIKDPDVRRLAMGNASTPEAGEFRRHKCITENKLLDIDLISAFEWDYSEEGYDYWKEINIYGKVTEAKKRPCPEVPANDQVNPSHYKENLFGKELQYVMIDTFGEEKYKAFCQLNAYKYRMRAGNKNEDRIEEDIRKAMWYEEKLKEL